MNMEFILVSNEKGIARISLNRPDKRNAMHGAMVSELLTAIQTLARDDSVRVLIIDGKGENFCAGGDIGWMQTIATATYQANQEDALLLAQMINQLYLFPRPTIALTHGAVMGGGLGLTAACDIAIAADNSKFSLSEVKIGITPSIISPYVINAIGQRAAYYYFLTGEMFSAQIACDLGLVHEVLIHSELIEKGLALAAILMRNSPHALFEAKALIRHVAKQNITEKLLEETAHHLADLRASKEAQEGLKAFMEKRAPVWADK